MKTATLDEVNAALSGDGHLEDVPIVVAKFRCLFKGENFFQYAGRQPDANMPAYPDWCLPQDAMVEVKLNPVYESTPRDDPAPDGGSQAVKENRIFGNASPAGQLAMSIRNRNAADRFELGQSYYVVLIPAEG